MKNKEQESVTVQLQEFKQKIQLQKPNVETMLLSDVQKKAWNKFCQNYIDSDYSKKRYLLSNMFSKVENKEEENGVTIKKAINSHRWSRNER